MVPDAPTGVATGLARIAPLVRGYGARRELSAIDLRFVILFIDGAISSAMAMLDDPAEGCSASCFNNNAIAERMKSDFDLYGE